MITDLEGEYRCTHLAGCPWTWQLNSPIEKGDCWLEVSSFTAFENERSINCSPVFVFCCFPGWTNCQSHLDISLKNGKSFVFSSTKRKLGIECGWRRIVLVVFSVLSLISLWLLFFRTSQKRGEDPSGVGEESSQTWRRLLGTDGPDRRATGPNQWTSSSAGQERRGAACCAVQVGVRMRGKKELVLKRRRRSLTLMAACSLSYFSSAESLEELNFLGF